MKYFNVLIFKDKISMYPLDKWRFLLQRFLSKDNDINNEQYSYGLRLSGQSSYIRKRSQGSPKEKLP